MIASPHAVGDVIQKRQHGGQHAHARHPVAVLHIGRYVVAHLDALRQQPLLVPAERLDYIAARSDESRYAGIGAAGYRAASLDGTRAEMKPERPVLAERATARRCSMARRREMVNRWR